MIKTTNLLSNVFDIKIKDSTDKKLLKFYRDAKKATEDFYGTTWDQNPPQIFLAGSRKEFDVLVGKETEDWVEGEATSFRTIVLLSPDVYETESRHKYSDREYLWLIKHELSHLYYKIFSNGNGPVWMDEGFALYSSGELENKKKPKELSKFLEHYNGGGSEIYEESGFAVKTLIDKYSKKKVLGFVSKMKNIYSEADFFKAFRDHFTFDLTYVSMNSL